MWIYDYKSERDNPYRNSEFVQLTHMCYVDNLPNWRYPWHKHADSFELTFITGGRGSLAIENQTIPLERGSISIVMPKTMHCFTSPQSDGMRYYALRFLEAPESGELQSFFLANGNAVTPGTNYLPYIENSMRLLFNIHQSNGGIADEAFQSVALGLVQLAKTLFCNKTFSVQLDSRYFVNDIIYYISEHYKDKITLASLGKQFHVSPSHLSRIFFNTYHISPINYLINSRITMSTEFLLKTDMPISDVAEQVGYNNPAHYSNMFAKRIGCSPSEYRERNQQFPLANQ